MKGARWVDIPPVIGLVVVGLIVPLRSVAADAGPRPSMSFRFLYQISPPPAILSGEQLECDDPQCTSAEPLARMGRQGFNCGTLACSSMAYDYSAYHRLRVDFSDGRTRESNVFGKRYFQAVYQVTVREDDLVVEEQRGGGMPLFFYILGSGLVFIAAAYSLIFLGILLVVVVRASDFSRARGLYITAWLISLLPLALEVRNPGVFAELIVTLVVELVIALAYGLWRKRPLILLLTVVSMMNVLTNTVLTSSFLFIPGLWAGGFSSLLIGEAIIWLVEAGILALALRKQARLWESLALSAALNLASFGVGWLLRV